MDWTASKIPAGPLQPPHALRCQHFREAGEGMPSQGGRGVLRGVQGPFDSALGLSHYGGASGRADSHCSIEASTGRVVETSNHGVQDKGNKLEPKKGREEVKSGRGGRTKGRADEEIWDTEPRQTRPHLPALSP